MQWGLDIIGPLPTGKSNMQFIFVVTDYFKKWIKAQSFFKIEAVVAIRFVKQNILYRFRVPKVLVMDNGSQFDSQAFRDICNGYSREQQFASRSYP